MDIKTHILAKIQKQKQLKASEIIKETGFSRTYVSRALRSLRDEGKIISFGRANRTMYVIAEKDAILSAKRSLLSFSKLLDNTNLNEDLVLEEIKRETGIFLDLKDNIANLVSYAFLEMLNNAIDHSQSKNILVLLEKNISESIISFIITDRGVGIFNKIRQKFDLPDNMSAIQELLKGKKTSAPEKHSGQGIFFTSKMADAFLIESANKRMQFVNTVEDIYISDIVKEIKGTEIHFVVSLNSDKSTKEVFDKFSDQDNYEFSKTRILIKLYKINKNLLSRSEARRIIFGLEKFKEITLDFAGVETIGQSFADEIFRVWHNIYPDKKIEYINANENVEAMIKMAM
jgi:DNA-binding transcriptional regulator GbsR (MarR family)